MLSGVKRSTPFINKLAVLTVLFAGIFFFKSDAQILQRGGLKKDTLQLENEVVEDTLNTNPIDSTKQTSVELSYRQRFQSIQFTKDLNVLNYHTLDTVVDYFHQFDPGNKHQFQRYSIGPIGSPSYNLLPNFTQQLSFNSGMNQFKPYQFNKDSIAVFKVNAPYTYLNWIFGTKAHQSFEALHANRIKNIAQFGLRFRRMGGEGYYSSQKTGHSDFSAYLSYDTPNKRYKNIFTILNQNYAFQQNGGIMEGSINSAFNSSQVFLRDLVPINLSDDNLSNDRNRNVSDAISREKKWTFAFNQYLNFGQYLNEEVIDTTYEQTDSLIRSDSLYIKRFVPQFRLKHRIELANHTYSYEDANGNRNFSLYPRNLLVEPGYYVDSIQQKTWHHELAFIQTGKGFKRNQFNQLPVNTYVGLHVENVHLSQQFNSDTLKTNNAWLQAKVMGNAFEKVHYEVDFQYALFKNTYQSKGHYLNAKLSYHFPETQQFLGVKYLNNHYKPSYLYQNYQSNFYSWQKTFPIAETRHFEAFYENKEHKLRTAYQQIRLTNYVVFDTTNTNTSAIRFMRTNGTIHRFSINKTFELGWWLMRNQFHFQNIQNTPNNSNTPNTQNELLFMPKVVYQGTWYYSSNLFKRALQFNVGIDVRYTSNFKLPAYHPVTGQFFALQEEHSFQSYPVIDFFFNFKIKTATFFFKTAYVNQGLFQRGYYAAYNYPQADIAVQGGISWRFFD